MDKLSFASRNREALSLLDVRLTMKSRETIFPAKRLFQRFTSEVTLFLLNFHRRRLERYEQLAYGLSGSGTGHSEAPKNRPPNGINISEGIVEAVLSKLHAFEDRKGFLDADVSLISLAMELNTNSSYLSKIINHTKQKPFKKYLNDLRVAYAYDELQSNSNIRKYTMEAIARDFGFKSAENFSKKFSEVYGIYPSKFLREMGN